MRKNKFSIDTYYDPGTDSYIKEATPESVTHLQYMLTVYWDFNRYYSNKSISLCSLSYLDQSRLSFESINGISLSDLVPSNYHFVIDSLLEVIGMLSSVNQTTSGKLFFKLFWYFKFFFSRDLVFGLIDITDSNVFIESNWSFVIIDYEWYIPWWVPRNFLLYRAAINLYYRHKSIMDDNWITLLTIMKDLHVKWWLEPFYYYRERNFQSTITVWQSPNLSLFNWVCIILSRYCTLFLKAVKQYLS
jgi:hypothetical protein